ncbi:MAG TPA: LuxR C-terminal-related transcriptional regulator [Ktedonobacteraceae bacterium]|nr:LuxR C-terminal-related transcriptional regulator [Ktedonobacteraceae bacterium]
MKDTLQLQEQLPATKFFIPSAPKSFIGRPDLLKQLTPALSLNLTLVSAPAGFGKTTLLSAWVRSLPAQKIVTAWISLDEEDNNPIRFWLAMLTALEYQRPERFAALINYLQMQQVLPLQYLMKALINLLVDMRETFLLVLDDYHLMKDPAIHTSLMYLLEHLPGNFHLVLATRIDPPLPLSRLRGHNQLLEIRTEQLRCTCEEAIAFLKKNIDVTLSQAEAQTIVARTEGWLAGLQLFGLSLQDHQTPQSVLEKLSGSQRYILDYLTDEVLQWQPEEVQTFLLATSILGTFTAALCDAVVQHSGSQQMLERLEQANLFVIPLDTRRNYYRYHALFAEALRYRLERSYTELVPKLHHRASVWYAEHRFLSLAITHAFSAQEWEWAADLIERLSITIIGGMEQQELALQRRLLERLPIAIIQARPRLCLICAQSMYQTNASPVLIENWLQIAEETLTAQLAAHPSAEQQEQKNLLGEVLALRGYLLSYQKDGQKVLPLLQQAEELLAAHNFTTRAQVAFAKSIVYYYSSLNTTETAIDNAYECSALSLQTNNVAIALFYTSIPTYYLLANAQLHKAWSVTQQAIYQAEMPGGLLMTEVGWHYSFQAEILREWNRLDEALNFALQAVSLRQQTRSLHGEITGYSILLRIYLSRGELEEAQRALRSFEQFGKGVAPALYRHMQSHYTLVDQVRLWLARGEIETAVRWAEMFEASSQLSTFYARERGAVAQARILLAQELPALALERLAPLHNSAETARRWNYVLEIQLLQSLAYEMQHETQKALAILLDTLHIARPEGYIRSFVEEGPQIALLLARLLDQLRRSQGEEQLCLYIETILAAFPQTNHKVSPSKSQPALSEHLSEREYEVLALLAQGASNQEIARRLAITMNTVKRHVSHIYGKLGVKNRVQAVEKARNLDLL